MLAIFTKKFRQRNGMLYTSIIIVVVLVVLYFFFLNGLFNERPQIIRYYRLGNEEPLPIKEFCLDGSRLPPQGDVARSRAEPSSSITEIAKTIKEKYSELVDSSKANILSGRRPCRPVVFQYWCSESFHCGGLGDRFRGLAAIFWISLLTNSVFSHHWAYPVNLDVFFTLPLSRKSGITEMFLPRVPTTSHYKFVDAEQEIVDFFGDTVELSDSLTRHDLYELELNSLVALEILLKKPYYRPMVDFYGIGQYNYTQLLAIALEVLLSEPTMFVEEAARPFLMQIRHPDYDASFGVQIRLGSDNWHEYARVRSDQIDCFVNEIAKTAIENNYHNIVTFLTADSDFVSIKFEELVAKHKLLIDNNIKVKVITAASVAAVSHIDRSKFDSDPKASSLRTFIDWLVLSSPSIDHLVISRSSFGETASIMRLAKQSLARKQLTIRRLAHEEKTACVFHDFEIKSVWMEESNNGK